MIKINLIDNLNSFIFPYYGPLAKKINRNNFNLPIQIIYVSIIQQYQNFSSIFYNDYFIKVVLSMGLTVDCNFYVDY